MIKFFWQKAKCPWEKIDDFKSLSEFERLVRWMEGQLKESLAREIPVKTRYSGAETLTERWFVHVESGEKWRIVWPDPPFVGVFEPI